jgi:hypothetical protein
MSHPLNHLRANKIERSRVKDIVKGYARGGAIEPEMEEDDEAGPASGDTSGESGRKAMKRGGKPKMKMEGNANRHHMGKKRRGGKIVAKSENSAPMEDDDKPKRADGGRVKRPAGQTIVNVMAGGDKSPPPPPQQVPVKVPVPVPAPPPQMAGPPPGAMPPSAGMPTGGMSPGMLGRAKGGRVAKGTRTYEDGLKNGTQVSHSPGKNDLKNMIPDTPVIPVKKAFARGGAAPHMTAGAGSGEGRIEKIEAYGKK